MQEQLRSMQRVVVVPLMTDSASGAYTLAGGAGVDIITGGTGNDIITGAVVTMFLEVELEMIALQVVPMMIL